MVSQLYIVIHIFIGTNCPLDIFLNPRLLDSKLQCLTKLDGLSMTDPKHFHFPFICDNHHYVPILKALQCIMQKDKYSEFLGLFGTIYISSIVLFWALTLNSFQLHTECIKHIFSSPKLLNTVISGVRVKKTPSMDFPKLTLLKSWHSWARIKHFWFKYWLFSWKIKIVVMHILKIHIIFNTY